MDQVPMQKHPFPQSRPITVRLVRPLAARETGRVLAVQPAEAALLMHWVAAVKGPGSAAAAPWLEALLVDRTSVAKGKDLGSEEASIVAASSPRLEVAVDMCLVHRQSSRRYLVAADCHQQPAWVGSRRISLANRSPKE
ncbi:hypothetical protein [Mycobacterium sp. 1245805.9]|uniref:hypothetical protein n=1 Tax=Mycobacterium sp. 1245805.9 TaxID=1856862 RepID=UPI0012EA72CF|nr:hypothetical protein [Mycobacterium sp. 1245805.9]